MKSKRAEQIEALVTEPEPGGYQIWNDDEHLCTHYIEGKNEMTIIRIVDGNEKNRTDNGTTCAD